MCRSSIWASCIDRRSDDVTKRGRRGEERRGATREREERREPRRRRGRENRRQSNTRLHFNKREGRKFLQQLLSRKIACLFDVFHVFVCSFGKPSVDLECFGSFLFPRVQSDNSVERTSRREARASPPSRPPSLPQESQERPQ